jgi:putative hemolysin
MHTHWLIFVGCSLALFAPSNGQAQALPNPSAGYCVEVGATLVHLQGPHTDTYFCAVDNGLIEQWTLFRAAKLHLPSLATQRFLDHGPYHRSLKAQDGGRSFCKACGGRHLHASSPDGKDIGVCHFNDSSVIGSYTLWLGASAYPRLADLLGAAR